MQNNLFDLVKKSGLVFIGRIFGVFLGLIFNFIAARYLGANTYGEFMFVFTIISFIPMILKLGLDQGLIAMIPRLSLLNKINERNSTIAFSLLCVFILSSLFSLVVIIYNEWWAEVILNNSHLGRMLILMAPLIVLLSLQELLKGVFRGIDRVEKVVIVENFIIPSLKIILFLLCFFLGLEIQGIVVAFLLSTFIGIFILLQSLFKAKTISGLKFSYSGEYKKIFLFSLPLIITPSLVFIINQSDVFMIGYFLQEDDVGIYNIALRIGTMSSFILIAFNTMFAPLISTLYSKSDIKSIEYYYKIITKWILTVNLVFFSLISLLSNQIMHLFGIEFVTGSVALILISSGQVINSAVGSAGYIIIMTDKGHYELYNSLFMAILNICLNLWLIPIYGINGAAIASLVAVSIGNIIKLLIVYRNYRIHPYNSGYVKIMAIVSIVFIFVLGLKYTLNTYWLFELIIFTTVYIFTFILLYIKFALSNDDKMVIKNIFPKKFKQN
ncbi:flippase [Halobacillus ihumii]|uniref:flippase n=1 Tax=Halobacillus ihumii TaxID=2686092 RepID=UPI0013D17EC6|nr:flippase [Halobacillus ihumii]